MQHDAVVIDSDGNVLYDSFAKHRKVRPGTLKNWLRNSYHGCLIAFKKEIVDCIVPLPISGCFHDQWIGMIADTKENSVFINDILMEYRRYDGNASSYVREPFKVQLKKRIITMINYIFYLLHLKKRI